MPKPRIIFREILSHSHGNFEQQIMPTSLPSSLINIYYKSYIVCFLQEDPGGMWCGRKVGSS